MFCSSLWKNLKYTAMILDLISTAYRSNFLLKLDTCGCCVFPGNCYYCGCVTCSKKSCCRSLKKMCMRSSVEMSQSTVRHLAINSVCSRWFGYNSYMWLM